MTDIVSVSHVKKVYAEGRAEEVVAVNDVTFTIKAGETFGLVGESGSGKSTTGKLLMKLEDLSDGEINFLGQDIAQIKGRRDLLGFRKDIQMIFQDPFASLNPRMTVGEIIGGPMRVHGLVKTKQEKEAAVAELMAQVGLDPLYANRYPREFSGGQCQRVGIARALALKPKLIIADEAISALDVSIQAQIVNLLKDLKITNDLTYLFITHDLSMVKYISDRIGVMCQGRLVEIGTADEIYNNPLHDYTKSLLSAIPTADPESEKVRQRLHFDGLAYGEDQWADCSLVEVAPDHFVYCHSSEVAGYKDQVKPALALI
ncbi:ABC transporter ATP-binding protein [Aerococcus urinaeequi]|uniref:ABC transporter ATP-binding protein n=1 Tax=Aerococcus urinaeequi TaxID=51665 RepID=UPI003D6BF354